MNSTCFRALMSTKQTACELSLETQGLQVVSSPTTEPVKYIVPLKYIEYGEYGDLIIKYPRPYSIYLRGTIVTLFPLLFRTLCTVCGEKCIALTLQR